MTVRTACIVGGGVIGGGWAARFLLNGWDVAVVDPDPEAGRKIGEVIANARRSLPSLYDKPLPPEGRLSHHDRLDTAVAKAEWIQENVPERLDLKHGVLAEIAAAAPDGAIVASSTSGFKPSDLTGAGARAIVAHPFNPVYLLPLVELVGDRDTCARAADVLTGIGMYPLTVRKEIDAHIADRLLEAVWRESLWLIQDGICTTGELDDAIRMGFGVRWAQMGLFETYRIAGGEAGMAHFMAQFGPALEWPWTRLMDVPAFTDQLVALIAGQSDAQSGARSIRDLERLRDDNLVGILRSLKHNGSGAGGVVAAHEARLPEPEPRALPVTVARCLPTTWTDASGHVPQARIAELAAQATDRILNRIGAGPDHVAAGHGYVTTAAQTRVRAALKAQDAVVVTTQVLAGAGRDLWLFHRIFGPDDTIAATVETLLTHVDLPTRHATPPPPEVARALSDMAAVHAAFPRPPEAGRGLGGP